MAEYNQFSENITIKDEPVFDDEPQCSAENLYSYEDIKPEIKEELADNGDVDGLEVYEHIKEEEKSYIDCENSVYKEEDNFKKEISQALYSLLNRSTIIKEETVLTPSLNEVESPTALTNDATESSGQGNSNLGCVLTVQCYFCRSTIRHNAIKCVPLLEKNVSVCNYCYDFQRLCLRPQKDSFSCLKCKIVIYTETDLSLHVQYHKYNKTMCSCSSCNFRLSTLSSLYNGDLAQKKGISVKGKNICSVCNQSFQYKYELTSHSLSHNPNISECNVCRQVFKYKYDMALHYFSHDTVKDVAAKRNILPQTCFTAGAKISPSKNVQTKKVSCNILSPSKNVQTKNVSCNILSPSKNVQTKKVSCNILSPSKNVQTKKVSCNICFESFYSKFGLSIHLSRMHSNCRPNTSQLNLTAHKPRHYTKKVHTCDICSEKFLTERCLAIHTYNLHSDYNPLL